MPHLDARISSMAFGKFPSFSRKPGASVSEETYPKTKTFRDHKNLIDQNVDRSVERFEKKFKEQMYSMFDYKKEGRINFDLLTEQEIEDIRTFIAHASKRTSAGAIASPIFHKEVQRGKPSIALDEFAPSSNVGHDVMHSLMAYTRTRGESLVPAYMRATDKRELELYQDAAANLEEAYVVSFAELGGVEKMIREIRDTQGLTGEELVLAVMDRWEDNLTRTQGFKFSDPDYPRNNRLEDFVTVVRNLLHNMEQEEPDQNFEVHEFQRIARPLLERLRSNAE